MSTRSENESIATSVHGTHHIPKHYKEKNLFSSFHCRLFIGMFYNGGRKTGETTLQTWWLRSWVSTLGQAMKVAACPLSLQVMAQEPQSPCQAVGQSGEWVRANMFPWLLTQRCLIFPTRSRMLRDAKLAEEWEKWADRERSRRSKVLVPPINLCLHFSNVLSLRDKVIW